MSDGLNTENTAAYLCWIHFKIAEIDTEITIAMDRTTIYVRAPSVIQFWNQASTDE